MKMNSIKILLFKMMIIINIILRMRMKIFIQMIILFAHLGSSEGSGCSVVQVVLGPILGLQRPRLDLLRKFAHFLLTFTLPGLKA